MNTRNREIGTGLGVLIVLVTLGGCATLSENQCLANDWQTVGYADGANGLKVLQLTSPQSQPNFYGFSPEPKPELIAWKRTEWPALSLSKGIDRDRAVDETGHQMAVFGRLGSRPFTLEEMQELYLDDAGQPWLVSDEVP